MLKQEQTLYCAEIIILDSDGNENLFEVKALSPAQRSRSVKRILRDEEGEVIKNRKYMDRKILS